MSTPGLNMTTRFDRPEGYGLVDARYRKQALRYGLTGKQHSIQTKPSTREDDAAVVIVPEPTMTTTLQKPKPQVISTASSVARPAPSRSASPPSESSLQFLDLIQRNIPKGSIRDLATATFYRQEEADQAPPKRGFESDVNLIGILLADDAERVASHEGAERHVSPGLQPGYVLGLLSPVKTVPEKSSPLTRSPRTDHRLTEVNVRLLSTATIHAAWKALCELDYLRVSTARNRQLAGFVHNHIHVPSTTATLLEVPSALRPIATQLLRVLAGCVSVYLSYRHTQGTSSLHNSDEREGSSASESVGSDEVWCMVQAGEGNAPGSLATDRDRLGGSPTMARDLVGMSSISSEPFVDSPNPQQHNPLPVADSSVTYRNMVVEAAIAMSTARSRGGRAHTSLACSLPIGASLRNDNALQALVSYLANHDVDYPFMKAAEEDLPASFVVDRSAFLDAVFDEAERCYLSSKSTERCWAWVQDVPVFQFPQWKRSSRTPSFVGSDIDLCGLEEQCKLLTRLYRERAKEKRSIFSTFTSPFSPFEGDNSSQHDTSTPFMFGDGGGRGFDDDQVADGTDASASRPQSGGFVHRAETRSSTSRDNGSFLDDGAVNNMWGSSCEEEGDDENGVSTAKDYRKCYTTLTGQQYSLVLESFYQCGRLAREFIDLEADVADDPTTPRRPGTASSGASNNNGRRSAETFKSVAAGGRRFPPSFGPDVDEAGVPILYVPHAKQSSDPLFPFETLEEEAVRVREEDRVSSTTTTSTLPLPHFEAPHVRGSHKLLLLTGPALQAAHSYVAKMRQPHLANESDLLKENLETTTAVDGKEVPNWKIHLATGSGFLEVKRGGETRVLGQSEDGTGGATVLAGVDPFMPRYLRFFNGRMKNLLRYLERQALSSAVRAGTPPTRPLLSSQAIVSRTPSASIDRRVQSPPRSPAMHGGRKQSIVFAEGSFSGITPPAGDLLEASHVTPFRRRTTTFPEPLSSADIASLGPPQRRPKGALMLEGSTPAKCSRLALLHKIYKASYLENNASPVKSSRSTDLFATFTLRFAAFSFPLAGQSLSPENTGRRRVAMEGAASRNDSLVSTIVGGGRASNLSPLGGSMLSPGERKLMMVGRRPTITQSPAAMAANTRRLSMSRAGGSGRHIGSAGRRPRSAREVRALRNTLLSNPTLTSSPFGGDGAPAVLGDLLDGVTEVERLQASTASVGGGELIDTSILKRQNEAGWAKGTGAAVGSLFSSEPSLLRHHMLHMPLSPSEMSQMRSILSSLLTVKGVDSQPTTSTHPAQKSPMIAFHHSPTSTPTIAPDLPASPTKSRPPLGRQRATATVNAVIGTPSKTTPRMGPSLPLAEVAPTTVAKAPPPRAWDAEYQSLLDIIEPNPTNCALVKADDVVKYYTALVALIDDFRRTCTLLVKDALYSDILPAGHLEISGVTYTLQSLPMQEMIDPTTHGDGGASSKQPTNVGASAPPAALRRGVDLCRPAAESATGNREGAVDDDDSTCSSTIVSQRPHSPATDTIPDRPTSPSSGGRTSGRARKRSATVAFRRASPQSAATNQQLQAEPDAAPLPRSNNDSTTGTSVANPLANDIDADCDLVAPEYIRKIVSSDRKGLSAVHDRWWMLSHPGSASSKCLFSPFLRTFPIRPDLPHERLHTAIASVAQQERTGSSQHLQASLKPEEIVSAELRFHSSGPLAAATSSFQNQYAGSNPCDSSASVETGMPLYNKYAERVRTPLCCTVYYFGHVVTCTATLCKDHLSMRAAHPPPQIFTRALSDSLNIMAHTLVKETIKMPLAGDKATVGHNESPSNSGSIPSRGGPHLSTGLVKYFNSATLMFGKTDMGRTYLVSAATMLPALAPTSGYSRWLRMRPEFLAELSEGVACDAFVPSYHQNRVLEEHHRDPTNNADSNTATLTTKETYVYVNQDRAQVGHLRVMRRLVHKGISDTISLIDSLGRPLLPSELCEVCHTMGLNLCMLGRVAQQLEGKIGLYEERLTTVSAGSDTQEVARKLMALKQNLLVVKEEMCLRAFKSYLYQVLRQEGRVFKVVMDVCASLKESEQRALQHDGPQGGRAPSRTSVQFSNAGSLRASFPSMALIQRNSIAKRSSVGSDLGGSFAAPTQQRRASSATGGASFLEGSMAGSFRRRSFSAAPGAALKNRVRSVLSLRKVKALEDEEAEIKASKADNDDDEIARDSAQRQQRRLGKGSSAPGTLTAGDIDRALQSYSKTLESREQLLWAVEQGGQLDSTEDGDGLKSVASIVRSHWVNLANPVAPSATDEYAVHMKEVTTVVTKCFFGHEGNSKTTFLWKNFIVPTVRAKFKYRGSVSRPDVLIRSAVPRLFDLTGIHLAELADPEAEQSPASDGDDSDDRLPTGPARRKSIKASPPLGRLRQQSWAGSELPSGSIGDEDSQNLSTGSWDVVDQPEIHEATTSGQRRRSSHTAVPAEFSMGAVGEPDEDADSEPEKMIASSKRTAALTDASSLADEGSKKRARDLRRQERAKGVLNKVCRATRACAVGYVSAMEPVVKMSNIPKMPPLWCFAEPNSQTQFSMDALLSNTEKLYEGEGTGLRSKEAFEGTLLHKELLQHSLSQQEQDLNELKRHFHTVTPADRSEAPSDQGDIGDIPYPVVPSRCVDPTSGLGVPSFLASIANNTTPLSIAISRSQYETIVNTLKANFDRQRQLQSLRRNSSSMSSFRSGTSSPYQSPLAATLAALPIPPLNGLLTFPLSSPRACTEGLNEFANLLRAIGDRMFNDCESMLLKVINRLQVQLVHDQESTMEAVCNLGLLYWVERRFMESKRTILEALQVERLSALADGAIISASSARASRSGVAGSTRIDSSSQGVQLYGGSSLRGPFGREVLDVTFRSEGSFLFDIPAKRRHSIASASLTEKTAISAMEGSTLSSQPASRRVSLTQRGGQGRRSTLVRMMNAATPVEMCTGVPSPLHAPRPLTSPIPPRPQGSVVSQAAMFMDPERQSRLLAASSSCSAASLTYSLRTVMMLSVLGVAELGEGRQYPAMVAFERAALLLVSQLEELRQAQNVSLDEYLQDPNCNSVLASFSESVGGGGGDSHPSPFMTQPTSELASRVVRTFKAATEFSKLGPAGGSPVVGASKGWSLVRKLEASHIMAVTDYDVSLRREMLHKLLLMLASLYSPTDGDTLYAKMERNAMLGVSTAGGGDGGSTARRRGNVAAGINGSNWVEEDSL